MQRYREKLSRALLDRFDLLLAVPRPRAGDLAGTAGRGVSRRFASACSQRAGGSAKARRRGRTRADELLTRAVERLPLSGRGRARVARVAATIAALAGAEAVEPEHLAEALSYRPPAELTE